MPIVGPSRAAGPDTGHPPRWPYAPVAGHPFWDDCVACAPLLGGEGGLFDPLTDQKMVVTGANTAIAPDDIGTLVYDQPATTGYRIAAPAVPGFDSSTPPFTFSLWVSFDGTNAVLWGQDFGNGSYAFYVGGSLIYTSPSSFASWSYTVPTTGEWVHLGMEWYNEGADTQELWVDGVSQGTNSLGFSGSPKVFSGITGNDAATSNFPLDGRVHSACQHTRRFTTADWAVVSDPARVWSLYEEYGRRQFFLPAAVGGGPNIPASYHHLRTMHAA